MTEELYALVQRQQMGRVIWDRRRDRLRFLYEPSWRKNTASYPLSLSMPLAAGEHAHKIVEPFLWGLLPDNNDVLQRWGQRFQVSPRHAFQLLKHVGEECAGAVQLVGPERAAEWANGFKTGQVLWLKEREIGERMRLLLKDHSAARTAADAGQFSLAGAQPKTGFIYDPKRKRWGVPSGIIPTTHIFKPSTGAYDGYAENEHFCMRLARTLGMPVAASQIHRFGNTVTIVVERYDRIRAGMQVTRVHQEDMCQVLARMPQAKYQSQGGPSPREILALIREHSSSRQEDEARFIDALVFNWLICGTDAHAKNYSFLIAPNAQVRLAPLYDLVSALPYARQIPPRHAKLAMKIGTKYKFLAIGGREWKTFADDLRIDFDWLRNRIFQICDDLPEASDQIGREIKADGLNSDVIPRLVRALRERAALSLAAMRNEDRHTAQSLPKSSSSTPRRTSSIFTGAAKKL